MKISGSRKSIVILVVCIILFIFSLLFFSFRDVITNGIKYGRWFTLDKYEELLKSCEYSRNENEIIFRCQGLLDSMSVYKGNSNGICYQYKLIPKGEESITNNEFCENSDKISLDNPYKELNKILPISIVVSYSEEDFLRYTFQNILMKALSEKEIDSLFESGKMKLTSNKAVLERELYGPYSDTLHYMGICCVSGHSLLEGDGLYSFSLLGITIEKAFTEGEYMYFILNGYYNGKQNQYKIKVKSKGVVVILLDGSKKYLTKENIDKDLPSGSFDATVSYATTDFNWRIKDFKNNCTSKYSEYSIDEKSLCDNISISEGGGIEKMISVDEITKLITKNENDDVILNDLFFNYIYLKE